jgi:ribose transport system permease protein
MGIEINTYLQNVIRGLFVLAVVVVQARAVLGSKKRRT